MAATQKTRERFIELRAENVSFDKIAKKLKVSKTTLIAWARTYETDIDNLRAFTFEALNEQYKVGKQHRLEMWSEQLIMAQEELKKRGLGDVPTPKLIELLDTLSEKLQNEAYQVVFKSEEYIKDGFEDLSRTKKRDYWKG